MNGGLIMFLNCPAYMDHDGATRCGLPAEVEYRYTLNSSDGPLEGAKIRCLAGHWFNGPIASLTLAGTNSGQRQQVRRPNAAPAYYLGRPASVWITAMSPRRRRTTSHRVMLAATGG
jgi:hypothetical protein